MFFHIRFIHGNFMRSYWYFSENYFLMQLSSLTPPSFSIFFNFFLNSANVNTKIVWREKFLITYRRRLGSNRLVLIPGIVEIGVTLQSGVVNCKRFEPPPLLRFNIGAVVDKAPDDGRFIFILTRFNVQSIIVFEVSFKYVISLLFFWYQFSFSYINFNLYGPKEKNRKKQGNWYWKNSTNIDECINFHCKTKWITRFLLNKFYICWILIDLREIISIDIKYIT